MMDYKAFKQYVLDNVRNYLPPQLKDRTVDEIKVSKVNQEKEALVLKAPAEKGIKASSVSYPEDYYKAYTNGKPLAKILSDIARDLSHTTPGQLPAQLAKLSEWKYVKPAVICSVVGVANNQELLSRVPHKIVQDMALIYRVDLEKLFSEKATAVVYNELFTDWGISQEHLHQVATQNTFELMPPQLSSMNSIMRDFAREALPDASDAELDQIMPGTLPMYILTNMEKLHGATTLFYPGIKEAIAAQFGDYYIIPSSIHEVLIIPESAGMDVNNLREMVRAINQNSVAPEDRLTDNIYRYDRESQQLEIIHEEDPGRDPFPNGFKMLLFPEDWEPEI